MENDNVTVYVDNNLILRALFNESARRANGSQMFKHELNSAHACIMKDNGEIVENFDQLTELISAADESEIVHEREFSGRGHEELLVLRMQLPKGYKMSLSHVKLSDILPLTGQDVPFSHISVKKYCGQYSLTTDAPKIEVGKPWLHLSKEQVVQRYGWITFFIRKEDISLRSWMPGISPNTSVCGGIGEEMVFVRTLQTKPKKQVQQPPQPQKRKLTLNDIL